jgi:hypothetical protein
MSERERKCTLFIALVNACKTKEEIASLPEHKWTSWLATT